MIRYRLNCNNCNSLNVEKTLMSPNVLNSKDKIATISKDKKIYKIKKKIKKYQKFIKENFDYVGDNFAYEARAIHYNKDKKSKLKLLDISGLKFNPIFDKWDIASDKSVNYITKFKKS